jgi:hypothetical protein
MSPRTSIVVLAVACSVAACQKSSETQAEEAAQATAVKEQKEQKAMRELERGNSPEAARAMVEAQEAAEKAAREQRDVAQTLEREHERFRVLLTKEIAWIDRRVAELEANAATTQGDVRAEKERDVAAAREWRERLRQDLDVVEHPPPGSDWSAVKMRIERDLEENRPASMPRSYEKSYGI